MNTSAAEPNTAYPRELVASDFTRSLIKSIIWTVNRVETSKFKEEKIRAYFNSKLQCPRLTLYTVSIIVKHVFFLHFGNSLLHKYTRASKNAEYCTGRSFYKMWSKLHQIFVWYCGYRFGGHATADRDLVAQLVI